MTETAHGSLTMAKAHADALARIALAARIVDGLEPEPDYADLEGRRPFTSWCGHHVAAILTIRADADPAFMTRLAGLVDMPTVRAWWDHATSDHAATREWHVGEAVNDRGRLLGEERIVRSMVECAMMEAMGLEILGERPATRFSTTAPFAGLALDDARPVSRLADLPACESGAVMALPHSRGFHLIEAPTWRHVATLVEGKVRKARNPRGRYFEGVFKLDPRRHRGATHEVFMGS